MLVAFLQSLMYRSRVSSIQSDCVQRCNHTLTMLFMCLPNLFHVPYEYYLNNPWSVNNGLWQVHLKSFFRTVLIISKKKIFEPDPRSWASKFWKCLGNLICTMGIYLAWMMYIIVRTEVQCTSRIIKYVLYIFFQVLTRWVKAHPDVIQTGSDIVDNTITVLLSTSILIGGITGCVFDHVIPGIPMLSFLFLTKSSCLSFWVDLKLNTFDSCFSVLAQSG
jgi:hypothetical protein